MLSDTGKFSAGSICQVGGSPDNQMDTRAYTSSGEKGLFQPASQIILYCLLAKN